jgi:hypothetical protein
MHLGFLVLNKFIVLCSSKYIFSLELMHGYRKNVETWCKIYKSLFDLGNGWDVLRFVG